MWETESSIWSPNLESTLARSCRHPKSVILDTLWAEDIFLNNEGIMICHKAWLLTGVSLHAPNYQCTEIIHPSIAQKMFYSSFKIFSRFWLVQTTRIIHHNHLLFTKFGKNLRHIESMTSKVQPAENYWTDDVKSAARCGLLYLVSGKTKRNGETPLRRRKCFEWIKQLLNSAFVGYEEFCRSRKVLSISAFYFCLWHPPWSAEFFISYSASFNNC